MTCENKNYLLDLYFLEGDESKHNEAREHLEVCGNCREYMDNLKKMMKVLETLNDEKPSSNVLDNIIHEVSTSAPKQVKLKSRGQLIPILQIAFGQIFLSAVIYFLKINIALMPAWKAIRESWLVESLGSTGTAVILVLIAGTFLALSLAPILLFESDKKKIFS